MSKHPNQDRVSGRFWGPVAADDYSPDPVFLESSEEGAHRELERRYSLDEEHEDRLSRHMDYVVICFDMIGLAWNSYDRPPEHVSVEAIVDAFTGDEES